MSTNIFTLLLFCIPAFCLATDRKPWYGNEYEAELRLNLLYQNYSSIQTPERHEAHDPHHDEQDLHHGQGFHHHANDVFAALSATYPFQRYRAEFEITAAHTHHQNHRFDNFRISGSYLWLDDTETDPFSLATGITLDEPLSRALHDISSFHHGHIEGEIWISFGQRYECPCSKDYILRWWNIFGIGLADVGSPWIREEAALEFNDHDEQQFRIFMNTLWGVGKNNLDPHDFAGYGPIRHASVDLGFRYSYDCGCWGTLSLEYARRVYAHNFPENTNLVFIEYYFPFGSQAASSYY